MSLTETVACDLRNLAADDSIYCSNMYAAAMGGLDRKAACSLVFSAALAISESFDLFVNVIVIAMRFASSCQSDEVNIGKHNNYLLKTMIEAMFHP